MDKTPIHQKWLKRAKSNLVRAKQPKPEEVYYEDLCYDAQQSVEKSFKAVLCFYNIKFRLVHDIGELNNNASFTSLNDRPLLLVVVRIKVIPFILYNRQVFFINEC